MKGAAENTTTLPNYRPSAVGSLWRHRFLIVEMSRREVLGRYKGSALGFLWSLLIPLLMLSVYTLVFGSIFETKWGTSAGSHSEFALILFCGLTLFNFVSEVLTRAPRLVIDNAVYVKKVSFPLETLPWIAVFSALFHLIVSFLILLVGVLFVFGPPHMTWFYFFPLLLPLLLGLSGLCFLLSSTGVYLRDLSQVIGVTISLLLFLSPIFFPISAVPGKLRTVLELNPMSYFIENMRGAIFVGQSPSIEGLAIATVGGITTYLLGFLWFQKTRKGFADVI